jgi:hypothetical protein
MYIYKMVTWKTIKEMQDNIKMDLGLTGYKDGR